MVKINPSPKLGKKGALADALSDLMSYLWYFLVVFIFILLFSMQSCQVRQSQRIYGAFDPRIKADLLLDNLLETHLSSLNLNTLDPALRQEMERIIAWQPSCTYADFLTALPYTNFNNKYDAFQTVTTQLFEKHFLPYDKNLFFHLEAVIEGKSYRIFIPRNGRSLAATTQSLPLPDGTKIQVILNLLKE